jgi:hypothetical protein
MFHTAGLYFPDGRALRSNRFALTYPMVGLVIRRLGPARLRGS